MSTLAAEKKIGIGNSTVRKFKFCLISVNHLGKMELKKVLRSKYCFPLKRTYGMQGILCWKWQVYVIVCLYNEALVFLFVKVVCNFDWRFNRLEVCVWLFSNHELQITCSSWRYCFIHPKQLNFVTMPHTFLVFRHRSECPKP
ncbi:hypothetical protein Bca52824_004316 [Brassica carinata]|uniref:Uncharacterized protein n=1 Tax=Brassica carinata TaxID=52824 RepID=A0A8X7WMT8_BRACI|nr:hypothetical protein Bca52824_004316 [Brassica carinata]